MKIFKLGMMLVGMLASLVACGVSFGAAIASTNEIHVAVKGMVCSSCAKTISQKLQTQPGVDHVKVDLKSGQVNISMKDGQTLSDEQIKSAVNSHDYTVAQIKR